MNEQNHQVAQPRLLVMCGLPRSGKSTYARTLGYPIVSPDALRLALHGERFIASAELVIWAIAGIMVSALFKAGHARVIVDATNTTRAARRKWESPEWKTEFLHVVTPAATCLERAALEGDAEIVPVIERMAAQWEPFETHQIVLSCNSSTPWD